MDKKELLERKRSILAELDRLEESSDCPNATHEFVDSSPPTSTGVKEDILATRMTGCPFKRSVSSSETSQCSFKRSKVVYSSKEMEEEVDYPCNSDVFITRNGEETENGSSVDAEISNFSDLQGTLEKVATSASEESSSLSDMPNTVSLESQENKNGNEKRIWKTVMETSEDDNFDTLPDGWTIVTHNSGIPIYLHRASRVVSVSRPYMIFRDNVLAHHIPVSAIPCLQRKRMNKMQKPSSPSDGSQQEILEDDSRTSERSSRDVEPMGDVRKFEESRLSAEEVTEYASSIFKFTKIKVNPFTRYDRKRKCTEETLKSVGLTYDDTDREQTTTKTASGLSLIHIPTQDMRFNKRGSFMNPKGKTSVAILTEYVQRAIRGRVFFDVVETNNTLMDYGCSVLLIMKRAFREDLPMEIKEKLAILAIQGGSCTNQANDHEEQLVIGKGEGRSKKKAKLVAAEAVVKVFLPSISFDSSHVASIKDATCRNQDYDHQAIALFENMLIDDPRVADLCERVRQPKPYELLKQACRRSIKLQGMVPVRYPETDNNQLTKVTIKVGPYSQSAVACGAKVATHRAAQAMLKELHPELVFFSSILRIYANADEKEEKRQIARQREEVVGMQNKGPFYKPNILALSKLRSEMHAVVASQLNRPKSFQ